MRKFKWLPVLGIVVGLALALSAVPALAIVGVTVSIDAPPEVAEGGDFIAQVDISYVEILGGAQYNVVFDPTILQLTNVAAGVIDSEPFPVDGWIEMGPGDWLILQSPAFPTLSVTGEGYMAELHFHVIGTACETSPIDFVGGILSDEYAVEIPATWVGGSVHVYAPRQVVSGTAVDGNGGGRGRGSADNTLPYPPGFEPCDEFVPCEWVWVWGYGFEFCQWYEIYIQPYEECHSVVEGQELDHMLSEPLGYPPVEPIRVHVAEDGTIGPIELFHVPEGLECTYWEIVADKIPPPAGNDGDIGTMPGIYNSDEDGLDAIACEEWGFHIIPEALTIVLVGVGLAGLGGYVVLRRRKDTNSDA